MTIEATLGKLTEDLPPSTHVLAVFRLSAPLTLPEPRPINLSLSQFLKDGCIGERQMALVCKKHKRPEGQQVVHILTLNLY